MCYKAGFPCFKKMDLDLTLPDGSGQNQGLYGFRDSLPLADVSNTLGIDMSSLWVPDIRGRTCSVDFFGGFQYEKWRGFVAQNSFASFCHHHPKPLAFMISMMNCFFWLMVSNVFYFHPYLGKIPILTPIFFKWVENTNQISMMNPRKSKNQTLPIGSREFFVWIILKTILCLVLDFQGNCLFLGDVPKKHRAHLDFC